MQVAASLAGALLSQMGNVELRVLYELRQLVTPVDPGELCRHPTAYGSETPSKGEAVPEPDRRGGMSCAVVLLLLAPNHRGC